MERTPNDTLGLPGWHDKRVSHDVDEFAGAQPSWSLHYEQLSRGRFVGQIEQVQLQGMRMIQESANCSVWQRGQLGQDNIGLAMPWRLPGHGSFNGQPLTTDTVMIGRSEELDLCLPADSGLIGIVVDAKLLGDLWEQLYHKRMSSWIERQVVATARPGLADAVRKLHLRVMADLEAAPRMRQEPSVTAQMRDAVLIEWIEALPTRISTDGLSSGEARRRVVSKACEFMRSGETEPPSMLQVCRHVGASPSKLEVCFRSVLGITPAKYMRSMRLNGVRRELLRSHLGSVQDVAARWGFWHVGEFAATYRRQFGELPSQTLQRSGSAPLA